jgi:hypothetical protein
MIIIFAFTWSAGGNLDDETRFKFSRYLRDGLITKVHEYYPYEGHIYDFWVDFET